MRFLIVLALFGAALAAPKNGQRIVGGNPTTINEYPFMANMQYQLFGVIWMQWCGGSILTPTVVLSAAHCYYGDTPAEWRVRAGSTQYNGGSTHQISRFILHPEYDDLVLKNDVAIAHLATPFVYSETVRGATLPGPSINPPDGTVVVAVGWGALYSDGPSAETLQHVEKNVINQELCAQRYAFLKTQPGFEQWPDIDDGMLCTGILDVGGKDACQGDSGGPVVLGFDRHILMGVTSWGYQCAHEKYPGVNARVPYYYNWIMSAASS